MASSFQTSALCLALLWLAAPAAAQPDPTTPEAAEPGGVDSDLVARAIALRKRGDEAAAIELLREAYVSERTPRVAGHLGLAERALGLSRDAEEHLVEALDATDDEWVRANEELLSDALRYARRQLAWVRIEVRPKGVAAAVRVAGEPADISQRVRVKAGSVTVEASADGYAPKSLRAELAPDKELLVTIDLVPLPSQAPPAKPPKQPQPGAPPASGSTADSSGASHQTWAYVSGGVGLVGLGLATYFGLQALDQQATAKDLCPETRCANPTGVDADSDARRNALFSDISLGVGVVALGVSVYLLLSDTKPSAARADLTLWAAPGGGGARLAF